MKVAFLFSGQIRDLPYDLFRKSLLNLTKDLDYSIFSFCWKEKGKSLNHKSNISKLNSVKNIEEHLEFIFRDFNVIKLGYESFNEFKRDLPNPYKKILYSNKYHYGTINSLPQIYSIYKSFKLLEESDQYFDLVFRCRFDSIYIHPLNLFPLKNILASDHLFNINFGRAYYPKRIYDIFFGGSFHSMYFLSDIWSNVPDLINNQFDNGLDKRDCCRILFVSANLNKIKVKTLESRICDVYRNNGFDYEKYLFSSHIIKFKFNKRYIIYLQFFERWFKYRNIGYIKILKNLLIYLIYLPVSYLKRLKYFFKNYRNFF